MTDATITTPRGVYTISADRDRIDVDVVHRLLADTYWAAGRSREVVERSITGSLAYGVFDPAGALAGFARVVTDAATHAWLCDVIVHDQHRGLGLGKALVAAIVADPRLAEVRFVLRTADAHGLYEQFGFEALTEPERWMVRPAPVRPSPGRADP